MKTHEIKLPPRIKDWSIKPVDLRTAKMLCDECGNEFRLAEILPKDFKDGTRISCPRCLSGKIKLTSKPH